MKRLVIERIPSWLKDESISIRRVDIRCAAVLSVFSNVWTDQLGKLRQRIGLRFPMFLFRSDLEQMLDDMEDDVSDSLADATQKAALQRKAENDRIMMIMSYVTTARREGKSRKITL